MKISLNWLKEYIDIPSTPTELGNILTSLGLEVEGMEKIQSISGGLEGLVVGQVKTCWKHPNADRLSVTTVDVGQAELLHIVCGAPNVSVDQKVVVAPVNTRLYPSEGEPFIIKRGKIRGEVSEGMICAEDEIGLGREHKGIIVLKDDALIGSAVSEYFNIGNDTVYDIGLTPNRSDATSHIGVARDLLAYYRYYTDPSLSLKLPEEDMKVEKQNDKVITVEIRDREGCPRFSGITLSNVSVGESPQWMQDRLKAIGIRPINNIVDITNYVLHEFGQPLHAYDFDKIGKRKIHVQTLPAGTKFESLDEKERILHEDDLIVCDGNDKGLCIAGVFGGMDSGVTNATTEIFLEAAHFNSLQLRKTSTRHQLRTEAAKCFEKGTDPAHTVTALYRASSLMCKYAGAHVSSELIDEYDQTISPKHIILRIDRVNQIIGCEIKIDQLERILDALEICIVAKRDKNYTVSIPTNKADVTREIDVVEEILRIYGFNNVPISLQLKTSFSTSEFIDKVRIRKIIADVLVNKGYNEIMGLSLVSSSLYKDFTEFADKLVKVNNTSNVHLDAMRPEMMMSSMIAAQYNINRQQKDIALYEDGRSYQKADMHHEETEWITIVTSGEVFGTSWRQEARSRDFYDIKGAVLSIFSRLGIKDYQSTELNDERFDYGLELRHGPKILASFGAVSALSKNAVDIDQDVFYAEIQVDHVHMAAKKSMTIIKEIPKYPSSRRDLALTLDENVAYREVESVIKKSSGSLLKEVQLFDIYRDEKHLAKGTKSYAVSLTFEDSEKNLKDKVIDKIVSKVVSNLGLETGARLR